jgi:hypothetical protein
LQTYLRRCLGCINPVQTTKDPAFTIFCDGDICLSIEKSLD